MLMLQGMGSESAAMSWVLKLVVKGSEKVWKEVESIKKAVKLSVLNTGERS